MMNIFVLRTDCRSEKSTTFDSGSKELIPLVEDVAASKIRGSFFAFKKHFMAANKRCAPLIEGFNANHLNGIDGLSRTCFPIPASLKLYGYLIRCNGVEQVSSFGGRGKLAFLHLLSFRFLFSAIYF